MVLKQVFKDVLKNIERSTNFFFLQLIIPIRHSTNRFHFTTAIQYFYKTQTYHCVRDFLFFSRYDVIRGQLQNACTENKILFFIYQKIKTMGVKNRK